MKQHSIRIFLLAWAVTTLHALAPAQNASRRLIYFTDKNNSPYSIAQPGNFLGPRALERRQRFNILTDSLDLPVNPAYLDSLTTAGAVTLLGWSRWLNAALIQTTDAAALVKINSFPFVARSEPIAARTGSGRRPDKFQRPEAPLLPVPGSTLRSNQADVFDYGPSGNQIRIHNGQFLHNLGARGQGLHLAFFDAGFNAFHSNRFFDSARARNQFKATWDFVQRNEQVSEDHPHGTNCFSVTAAYVPGVFVGSSPESNYYLLRTEEAATEYPVEEFWWGMGAEYADSAGVDIISSSLGYTTFDDPVYDYTYASLNGRTTLISRMAALAARKGLLVVTSAGNEGGSSWNYISAPADADSVLAVGAVNGSGTIAAFSSFGPTSDGRVKPDALSVGLGTIISTSGGTVTTSSGTSFAAPNLAGLAACLWQLFPEVNNISVLQAIRQAGDRFSVPHPQYGYGLPDMKRAMGQLLRKTAGVEATANNCTSNLRWSSKDAAGMQYILERRLPQETAYHTLHVRTSTTTGFERRWYTYDDTPPAGTTGTIWYRLRQVVDTSNTGFFSELLDSVSLIFPAACSTTNNGNPITVEKQLALYPNPGRGHVQLRLDDPAMMPRMELVVFNTLGQPVYRMRFAKPAGHFVLPLQLNHLPSGRYQLQVFNDNRRYSTASWIKE